MAGVDTSCSTAIHGCLLRVHRVAGYLSWRWHDVRRWLAPEAVHLVSSMGHEGLIGRRVEHHLAATQDLLVGCRLVGLASLLILSLALSPGLSHLLELAWASLGPVLLHGNMCVQVVQRTVALLASSPIAGVQSLNLIVTSSRALLCIASILASRATDRRRVIAITGHV